MSMHKSASNEKISIVKEYLADGTSYVKLGHKYNVNESSIRKWVNNYQAFGDDVFDMFSPIDSVMEVS